MHTEEEAREKWCPHGRGRDDGGNRPLYGSAGEGPVEEDYCADVAMLSPCVASACMAWRWCGPPVEVEINGIWKITEPPEGWRYVVSYDDGKARFERVISDAPHTGYCGLSGSPSPSMGVK